MIQIKKNEIHLWYVFDESITDPILLNQYLGLLNGEELERQARFHFDKHRHQYLLTRATIRSLLSLYCPSYGPKEWIFEKNGYGKPELSHLSNPIDLQFNISHCDKLIVVALSSCGELGVDVEYVNRSDDIVNIAQRYFSASELLSLRSLPLHKRKERFFDLWTLKEAYIKACGLGLSIPLDHFAFRFTRKNINIQFSPERNDDQSKWMFWQIVPTKNHTLALAIRKGDKCFPHNIVLRNYRPMINFSKRVPRILRSSWRSELELNA